MEVLEDVFSHPFLFTFVFALKFVGIYLVFMSRNPTCCLLYFTIALYTIIFFSLGFYVSVSCFVPYFVYFCYNTNLSFSSIASVHNLLSIVLLIFGFGFFSLLYAYLNPICMFFLQCHWHVHIRVIWKKSNILNSILIISMINRSLYFYISMSTLSSQQNNKNVANLAIFLEIFED